MGGASGFRGFVGMDPDEVGRLAGDTLRAADRLDELAVEIQRTLDSVSMLVPGAPMVAPRIRELADRLREAARDARNRAQRVRESVYWRDVVSSGYWAPRASRLTDPTSSEVGAGLSGASHMLEKYHEGEGAQRTGHAGRKTSARSKLVRHGHLPGDPKPALPREVPPAELPLPLDKSKPPVWAKDASKALGAVSAVTTIYGAGVGQWKRDQAEYPEIGVAQRVGRATQHAIVEGGASAAGSWGGGTLGAMVGGACGPLAVVCGAGGAVVGAYVGAKVWATVGHAAEREGEALGATADEVYARNRNRVSNSFLDSPSEDFGEPEAGSRGRVSSTFVDPTADAD